MITSGVFWAVISLSVAAHWSMPKRWRDTLLFVIFAAFITYLDVNSLGDAGYAHAAALFAFCCLAYVAMQTFGGRYKWLTFTAAASVGVYLACYKYLPQLLHPPGPPSATAKPHAPVPGQVASITPTDVIVPLGASYFTFKIIHYVIECHRKHIGKHTFSSFLSYMFFLPMFTAGPIERFEDFQKNRVDTFEYEHVWRGGTRIIYGLVKKFVLVDMFLMRRTEHELHGVRDAIPLVMPSYSVDKIVTQLADVDPVHSWQFVINHYVTWYVDFSAYTDLAIGLGLLYGIKLAENFDWPFLVTNIGDFWKRYHMSLSNWAQRYVYFPILGSTRNAQLALFATMIAIGLWHAGNLNYLAWGAYQAAFLSVHLVWTRYKRRRIGREEDDSPFARLVDGPIFNVGGWAITFLGVCASAAFPATQTYGMKAGLRLMGTLVGIHIPDH